MTSNKCLFHAKEKALQHGFNAANVKLIRVGWAEKPLLALVPSVCVNQLYLSQAYLICIIHIVKFIEKQQISSLLYILAQNHRILLFLYSPLQSRRS